MTRKKLPLEYITTDSTRKAVFKRRKKGLFTKVNELSMLCGINACAVLYSSFDPQPEIWPPCPTVVHRVLTKFKEIPQLERAKKKATHEGYIMERIAKANAQRRRLRKDTREKEMTNIMNRCLSMKTSVSTLSLTDLNDLGSVIDYNLRLISKRIESLENSTQQQAVAVVSSPQPQPQLQLPVDPLPVDESKLNHEAMDPQMAPQPDDDDSFVVGEMINPYGDDNINIHNGVWPNSFYH